MNKAVYDFPEDVPTRDFHEDVTAVYAGRSSGKTTKAKQLVQEHEPQQVVWIDPLLPDPPDLDQLKAKILAGDRFIRFSATHPELAKAALLYCYHLSTKAKPLYVVCDEAADYLKSVDEGVRQVFHKGRHQGLGVLLVSQRPSGIHPDFRSQAKISHFGRLSPSDIPIAQDLLGREKAQSRANAPVGDFIHN